MRTPVGIIIFISAMLAVDFYVFQAVKTVSENLSPKGKMIVYAVYWSITALAIICFLVFVLTDQHLLSKKFRPCLGSQKVNLSLSACWPMMLLLQPRRPNRLKGLLKQSQPRPTPLPQRPKRNRQTLNLQKTNRLKGSLKPK